MKRAVIAPTALPVAALTELKQWLGINTTREDALLASLLHAALDMCEGFTGIRPIEAVLEEVWPVAAGSGWQTLATRPVQAIATLDALDGAGNRTLLPIDAYAISIEADGSGRFRIIDALGASRVALRFTAGLASGWEDLAASLRQGVIRLAAHQHRARDDGDAGLAPPLAVAALWQPWRRMRLT